jgi:hypothetical protein
MTKRDYFVLYQTASRAIKVGVAHEVQVFVQGPCGLAGIATKDLQN